MSEPDHFPTEELEARLNRSDLRFTKQRRVVFEALSERRDHPTATEVYERVKGTLPSISLATVYNTLETLVQCGLVRQVNIERAPSRFCQNLHDHGHFYCEQCAQVSDVDFDNLPEMIEQWKLPDGTHIKHFELSIKGTCPQCTMQREGLVS